MHVCVRVCVCEMVVGHGEGLFGGRGRRENVGETYLKNENVRKEPFPLKKGGKWGKKEKKRKMAKKKKEAKSR